MNEALLIFSTAILGWVIMIERRLSRLEGRLEMIVRTLNNYDKYRKES
jgi:hypothetical protein